MSQQIDKTMKLIVVTIDKDEFWIKFINNIYSEAAIHKCPVENFLKNFSKFTGKHLHY